MPLIFMSKMKSSVATVQRYHYLILVFFFIYYYSTINFVSDQMREKH